MIIGVRFISLSLVAGGLVLSAVSGGGEGISNLQNSLKESQNMSQLRSEISRVGCYPVKILNPRRQPGQALYMAAPVAIAWKVTLEGENNVPLPVGAKVCDKAGNVATVGANGLLTHPFRKINEPLPNVRISPEEKAAAEAALKSGEKSDPVFDWDNLFMQFQAHPVLSRAVISDPSKLDESGNLRGATVDINTNQEVNLK